MSAPEIIATNAAHPDWTVAQVAAHLGLPEASVRSTANRKRLTFAPKRPRKLPMRRSYAGQPRPYGETKL